MRLPLGLLLECVVPGDVDEVRVLIQVALLGISLMDPRAGRFSEIMDQFSSAQSGEDFKTINP